MTKAGHQSRTEAGRAPAIEHPPAGRAVRVGLVLLAINQGGPGIWAAVAPRSFYDDFPIPGHHWVSAFPPFNDHLTRDVGMLSVGLAVVLTAAAVFLEPRLVTIALLAALSFMVPHTIWHLGHLEPFGTGEVIAQIAVNAVAIAAGLACLRWSWTQSHRAAP